MKKIVETAHIAHDLTQSKLFGESVFDAIEMMQDKGLEVEIQYQQTDRIFSAYIIGRK